MTDLKISLEELESLINEHKSFIVNYGKSSITGQDIKELAYYDESIGKYRGDTGIWDYELLYQIANDEVENTSIEGVN